MLSAERAAAVPALAVAILVWNAMGYPLWMVFIASAIVLGVFFPRQGRAVLTGLLTAVKKVCPPIARLLWGIGKRMWWALRINRTTPATGGKRTHLHIIK